MNYSAFSQLLPFLSQLLNQQRQRPQDQYWTDPQAIGRPRPTPSWLSQLFGFGGRYGIGPPSFPPSPMNNMNSSFMGVHQGVGTGPPSARPPSRTPSWLQQVLGIGTDAAETGLNETGALAQDWLNENPRRIRRLDGEQPSPYLRRGKEFDLTQPGFRPWA